MSSKALFVRNKICVTHRESDYAHNHNTKKVFKPILHISYFFDWFIFFMAYAFLFK